MSALHVHMYNNDVHVSHHDVLMMARDTIGSYCTRGSSLRIILEHPPSVYIAERMNTHGMVIMH